MAESGCELRRVPMGCIDIQPRDDNTGIEWRNSVELRDDGRYILMAIASTSYVLGVAGEVEVRE